MEISGQGSSPNGLPSSCDEGNENIQHEWKHMDNNASHAQTSANVEDLCSRRCGWKYVLVTQSLSRSQSASGLLHWLTVCWKIMWRSGKARGARAWAAVYAAYCCRHNPILKGRDRSGVSEVFEYKETSESSAEREAAEERKTCTYLQKKEPSIQARMKAG